MTITDEISAERERQEEKWTPGPWRFSSIREDGSLGVSAADLPIVICSVHNAASFGDFINEALRYGTFGSPEHADTQQANAILIAKVPELYTALKNLLSTSEAYDGDLDNVICRREYINAQGVAKTILAKARGETPAETERLDRAQKEKAG